MDLPSPCKTLPTEWISPGFAIKDLDLDLLTWLPIPALQGPTTLIPRINEHFRREKYMSMSMNIVVELYLQLNCVKSSADDLK